MEGGDPDAGNVGRETAGEHDGSRLEIIELELMRGAEKGRARKRGGRRVIDVLRAGGASEIWSFRHRPLGDTIVARWTLHQESKVIFPDLGLTNNDNKLSALTLQHFRSDQYIVITLIIILLLFPSILRGTTNWFGAIAS